MLKYTILGYIIFICLIVYQVTLIIPIKNGLEKKVKGISTQIEQYQNYENNIEYPPLLEK